MKTFRALAIALVFAATSGVALAKLPPAPPLTDAQKEAAAAAKVKADSAAALANQQLESSMDRAAANYFANVKAQGKTAPAAQLAPSSTAGKTPAPAAKAAPAAVPAKQ